MDGNVDDATDDDDDDESGRTYIDLLLAHATPKHTHAHTQKLWNIG